MTWRVIVTDSVTSDLDNLSDELRSAVLEDLFTWVADGPPRTNQRVVGGVELFEDVLASGFSVTYFVDETEPYVAIVRVRRKAL